jgi:sigma-B regulation protein RsbU (phosphoserine phosphatase)
MSPLPRRRPLAHILRIVWIAPVAAIPFGIFFGTISGGSWSIYKSAYFLSVIFAYSISVAVWALQHGVLRRLPEHDRRGRPYWVRDVVLYNLTTMAGLLVGLMLVRAFIAPNFMQGGRNLVIALMFNVIFTALFIGIASAVSFYKDTLERAKSEQELSLARRIQRSFLLSSFPSMPRLEVHAENISSKQVSGDFYDVVPAGGDAFLVAIADVAGKGVPAALLSSMLQASLRTQAPTTRSTAEILRNINALVYRSTATEQFATFFLARVEESRLRLTYSNAGHNFPLVFRRGGGREALERGGTVVGILETAEFEEAEIALQPGDRVVLYTDGISEATPDGTTLFGEDRLCALVESLPPDTSARDTTAAILAGVRAFLGDTEPGDDMTVLALRVLEREPARTGAPRTADGVATEAVQPTR